MNPIQASGRNQQNANGFVFYILWQVLSIVNQYPATKYFGVVATSYIFHRYGDQNKQIFKTLNGINVWFGVFCSRIYLVNVGSNWDNFNRKTK